MRVPSASTVRWLLLSDLHFKDRDLDRVQRTAQWIVAEAERKQVARVVVCGDLLTSRTTQPTHVLSACYRFIGQLSDVVPRIHIVLGNHDLTYRREHQITALEALNIGRLAPYVSLHSSVSHHEWDGRPVLLLPFREKQHELTEAVAALAPNEARKTVAFAHLQINKSIRQRYVVSGGVNQAHGVNSITHRDSTGPYHFASLARTFTGHFHRYQTILQEQAGWDKADLQGSITYLGSPIQLSWVDLDDTQRGVVLFDPETLDHELLINPHAVGYTTVGLQQVLDGQVNESDVAGQNVMILGEPGLSKYVTARDKLVSLGAWGVRAWKPATFTLRTDAQSFAGLGASMPPSVVAIQPPEEPPKHEACPNTTNNHISDSDSGTEQRPAALDLTMEVREYVESLQLDESLLLRRDELVAVGQQMIHVSHEMADEGSDTEIHHRGFLNRVSQGIGTRKATGLARSSTHIFVAEPRTLTITNFLGVQGTTTFNFQQEIPRGLTLLAGGNGSGKSTLIEAMVWCQFGKCIRDGMAVNNVVNDNAGKDCSVKLEFENGYAILRHRKHTKHGNRVVVSKCGEPLLHFEHPTASAMQAAINKLLEIDYETYIRTVVLGHGSAASISTSRRSHRRQLIEASLGLPILDRCEQVSKALLQSVDEDMREVKSKLDGLNRTIDHVKNRLEELNGTQKQLREEAEGIAAALESVIREYAEYDLPTKAQEPSHEDWPQFDTTRTDCERLRLLTSKESRGLPGMTPLAELRKVVQVEISTLQDHLCIQNEKLRRLESSYARLQDQNHAMSASYLSRIHQGLRQRLEATAAVEPTGKLKHFQAVKMGIVSLQMMIIRSLLLIFRTLIDYTQGTTSQDDNQEAVIGILRKDIENSTSQLDILEKEAQRLNEVQNIPTNHADMMKDQPSEAEEARETLQQQLTLKQRDGDTYARMIEVEQSSLHSLHLEHEASATKLQHLATDRELFTFWYSTLVKRTRRVFSSSSPKSEAKSTTFREHVLAESLSWFNTLVTELLTVLSHDRCQARAIATDMLSSHLDSDLDSDSDSAETRVGASYSSPGPVLDKTLAIHSSLAYAKRSSGERKLIDLALFFTLAQLTWARSPHRAHYILVDEVFDSLDEAGQLAVIKLCGLMSQTMTGWIVVATQSRFLIERGPEEDACKVSIMRARMGQRGTKFAVDGQEIGVQG